MGKKNKRDEVSKNKQDEKEVYDNIETIKSEEKINKKDDVETIKSEEKINKKDDVKTIKSKEKINKKSKKDDIDIMQKKIAELEEKNIRLVAEYQNFKRRSIEESLKVKSITKKEVFSEIIGSIDNLERALSIVNFNEEQDEFTKGIKMVYDGLVNKLVNLGLEEIDCTGLANPNSHHVVATDNIKDKENDQILEVLQKGYEIDGILIRPAMVKANQK